MFDADLPCRICHKDCDDCECPACPFCLEIGNPECYSTTPHAYDIERLKNAETIGINDIQGCESNLTWRNPEFDPQVRLLERLGYLRMEYFGTRETGPMKQWVLTKEGREACKPGK
jgi:hypothetical protein